MTNRFQLNSVGITSTPRFDFNSEDVWVAHYGLQGMVNDEFREPARDDQLYPCHPSEARGTDGASIYPPALSHGGSPLVPGAPVAAPAGSTTSRLFGRTSDEMNSNGRYVQQQLCRAPIPHAGDPSFRGSRRQTQQHHGTPRSLAAVNDGRSAMSLGLDMSPPIGEGFPPPAMGQEESHWRQQKQSPKARSSAALSLPLVTDGGVDGVAYSPEAAGSQRHGQEQQPQSSAVGAVIAEVVSRRSRSQQQQGRDADIVRRGTPMSDGRQAMAQPRLLLSELDADGPGSPAGTGQNLRGNTGDMIHL